VRKVGVGVNSGFMLVRSRRREPIARLYADVVRRGLVEFYNRWNNVADALGWSFVVADAAVELRPTLKAAVLTQTLMLMILTKDTLLVWQLVQVLIRQL
jgi:hypothetical protein